MFLAAYFLVDGAFAIATGFQLKPARGWGWMAFNGVTTIALGGLIIWGWPFSGVMAIGVLIGIRLVSAGWTIIALGAVGEIVVEKMREAKEIG